MSYEQAPATAFVATACACCGRALLDAISVEAGIGPDCRAKYGYGEAQGPADWTRAAVLLGGASGVQAIGGEALVDAWAVDPQRAANILVRLIAGGRPVGGERLPSHVGGKGALVAALGSLGFAKLAHKLARRAFGVQVEDAGAGLLKVRAPYCEAFNDAIKRVPGQRWLAAEKVRTVPASARAALWQAIRESYPAGTIVWGSKGWAVL